MQTKKLFSTRLLAVSLLCSSLVLACHSNDYDTSDATEQTTVSPSPEMHMTPPDANHSLIDSSHTTMDSSMVRDTMLHEQHP